MHKSRLIDFISLLSKEEILAFKSFIKVDVFRPKKEAKQVEKLLQILIGEHPDYSNLSKEKIYFKIYKESYQATKMNRLMGRMTESVKQFIIFHEQQYEQTSMGYNTLLIARFLNRKKNKKVFNVNASRVHEWENSLLMNDSNFALHYYLFQKEISYSNSLFNIRNSDLNLMKAMESLDHFYYLSSLDHLCHLFAQHVFAIPLSVDSMIEKYHRLKDTFGKKFNTAIIRVFELTIDLMISLDDKAFETLEVYLVKVKDQIPSDSLKSFYAIRRNFCVLKYSTKDLHYLPKALNCYKQDLKSGYLYHDGEIAPSTLQSIVKIALRSGEIKWIKRVLDTHKNKIVGNEYYVYTYNLSLIRFAEKEYQGCLDLLEYNYTDIHYKTSAKRLEIKCFEELDSPILESKIKSFKIYIFRIPKKNLTQLALEGNNNFVDLLKQIKNPRTLKNASRIEKIRLKLQNMKTVAERDWLLQKLDQQL